MARAQRGAPCCSTWTGSDFKTGLGERFLHDELQCDAEYASPWLCDMVSSERRSLFFWCLCRLLRVSRSVWRSWPRFLDEFRHDMCEPDADSQRNSVTGYAIESKAALSNVYRLRVQLRHGV